MAKEKFTKELEFLKGELNHAVKKHPVFAFDVPHALCLVVEELGECAQAVNDARLLELPEQKAGALRHAREEASHIAVCAVRLMKMLGEENVGNF